MPVAFTEEWLAGIGADRDGRREFPRVAPQNPVDVTAGTTRDDARSTRAAAGGSPARVPARQLSASRPGATAGQHAQAAVQAVKAEADAGVMIGGDVCAPWKSKYGAIRTEGIGPNGERRVFDSRKEARAAREMNAEMSAGLIVSWVPQVSIPCGIAENGRRIRYRADALAILQVNPDGTFVGRLVDVKGRDTPASRAKRGALRQLHQLDVQVIT